MDFRKIKTLEESIHKPRVIYVSTYPPRECGIANFTHDLTNALDRFNPLIKSELIAINDNKTTYNYGAKVVFQITQDDKKSYAAAADFINKSHCKIVNIQHEFGIFGGEDGEFICDFLDLIKKPLVTTLHTLVPSPTEKKRKIISAIAQKGLIVVMTEVAKRILKKVYKVNDNRITIIPHGAPFVHLHPSSSAKNDLGLKNKVVLSTAGFINENKGVEYAISALSQIVSKYPNIVYCILGETHPQIRKKTGEKYRQSLEKEIKRLKLESYVRFENRYLSLEELLRYLIATDVYLTPYICEEQIASGALTYALACGKAIVSTPYLYAKEVLSYGKRGLLAKFRDTKSLAENIEFLLDNPKVKKKLEREAYKYGQKLIWPRVAKGYLNLFYNLAMEEKKGKQIVLFKKKKPPLKTSYLEMLTDNIGVVQHGFYSVQNRATGYALDDNARALIFAVRYYNHYRDEKSLRLVSTYLSFLYFSQKANGNFYTLMDYNKNFLESGEIEEDAYGRALWASGITLSSTLHNNLRATAKHIFDNALKEINNIKFLRAKAFAIMGLYYYQKTYPEAKGIQDKIEKLADFLVKAFREHSTSSSNKQGREWKWFEDELTYSNGRLPESLFLAYKISNNKTYLQIAKESLSFLTDLLIVHNQLVLIGNKGWCCKKDYLNEGKRPIYDQQPVDANSMVEVYFRAYQITREESYYKKALLSFRWFLGENSKGEWLYDKITGGCFDGLTEKGLNLNQGAESSIAYLLSRLCLENRW
ncbi:MAG: glycosyltransferase family 4 protein [Candidatus Omnitrophica bacterium]|nr:glycosyltransferase family 4 protein [Candidatus Omnitrophota bacterium]